MTDADPVDWKGGTREPPRPSRRQAVLATIGFFLPFLVQTLVWLVTQTTPSTAPLERLPLAALTALGPLVFVVPTGDLTVVSIYVWLLLQTAAFTWLLWRTDVGTRDPGLLFLAGCAWCAGGCCQTSLAIT